MLKLLLAVFRERRLNLNLNLRSEQNLNSDQGLNDIW